MVEGVTVSSHIASDNELGGELAARFLIEKMGSKGKIVELEGISGASATRERGAGFHRVIDATPGITVVAKQSADFDRIKGLNVMENIVQAHKDIQAVFAHNDEMALGALQAIQAAGLKDVIVIGFDANDDAIQSVEEGGLTATIQQKPGLIGRTAIEQAVYLMNGEVIEPYIAVNLSVISH